MMFRYFDWLAFLNVPNWTYIISTLGSAVAFGLIFGYIISMGLEAV